MGGVGSIDVLLLGRALNDKFSSPLRFKPSAAVTEARTAKRQHLAAKNREAMEESRLRRVEAALVRSKRVKARQESSQLLAHQSHFSKLSAGDKR